MKILWIGIKLTDRQYKRIMKSNGKICPEALIGSKLAGKTIQLKDIIGKITDES
jgi:hypothetical protein